MSSVSEHQALVSRVIWLLDLLQRTRLISYFSITRLYDALVSVTCVICGSFADFVFLLAMQRCYNSCIWYDIEFQAIDVKMAVKEYGISLANLPLLSKLSSISGN